MPKINVSFKQTTRDLKLFTYVDSLEEKSDFIKDAIEHFIKYNEETQNNKPNQNG